MLHRHSGLLACTAIIGTLAASPAHGQQTVPAAEAQSAQEQGAIQDIVVTARRRAESLQDAPVTVTAFGSEELMAKGINDFARLAQATPGINFDAFPRAAPRPFFRGIGSANQGAGGDPSSVAFLDGVYLGRAAMLGIDFFDMERIEVLKGPQGTLFGKNVVGGAINFITAKPADQFAADAQLTLGEFGQREGHLMLNAPLSSAIAARFVVGAVKNDGFRKTPQGRPLDDDDKLSARGQVLANIGASTSLVFAADYNRQHLAPGSRFNVRLLPFRTDGPFGYDDYDKPRIADPDRYGFIRTSTGGVRAELNSDALGFATLTAVAAWRTLSYDSSDDLDGTTAARNAVTGVLAPAIQVLAKESADSYSAETRLTSLHSGPISWVAGLYYNDDDIERERESETAVVDTSENRFAARSRNRSYAAFGEVQYAFDFGVNLFGGARYTDEKKAYEVTRLVGNPAAPTVSYTTAGSPGISREKKVTYRVGADWRVNDHVFVFGTVSTGFKSGAFQEQPGSAVLARIATAPEEVTNYEIGAKTDWLDRRLRFNLSAFIAKYSNLQTIQVIPDATAGAGGTRVSTDTGDATIKGIESELIFKPVEPVDLTVRYTYLHPFFDRLTQTSAILANGTAVQRDLAGMRLSRTPRHALTADLGFTTAQTSWGWLRGLISVDYQSDIYDDNDNDFIEYRRPRTLIDLSLTYHVNDRFSARLWAKNITDKEYRVFNVDTGGGVFVQYGPPRQIGVTFDASF